MLLHVKTWSISEILSLILVLPAKENDKYSSITFLIPIFITYCVYHNQVLNML